MGLEQRRRVMDGNGSNTGPSQTNAYNGSSMVSLQKYAMRMDDYIKKDVEETSKPKILAQGGFWMVPPAEGGKGWEKFGLKEQGEGVQDENKSMESLSPALSPQRLPDCY